MGETIRVQAGEISAQGATLAAVIEALPDPVLIADRGLQVVRANAAARRQFRVGHLPLPLARVLRDPGVLAAVEGALSSGAGSSVAFSPTLDRTKQFSAQVEPLGAEGRERGVLIALRERTEEVMIERMRSDFVANASHEIRTPLAAIQGTIETLRGAGAGRPARARHVPRPHGRRGRAHGAARRRPAVALADRARRPPAADRALRPQGRARAGRGADVRGRRAGQGPYRDPLAADAARGRGRRGPAAPARRQPRRQRDQVRRRGQDRDGRGGGARRRAR